MPLYSSSTAGSSPSNQPYPSRYFIPLVGLSLRTSCRMLYSAGGSLRCAAYGFPYCREYISSTISISGKGTLSFVRSTSRDSAADLLYGYLAASLLPYPVGPGAAL